MTRKFRVTIGGITYTVEVEEIGAPAAAPASPVVPAAPAPARMAPPPAVAPAPAAPAPAPAATPRQTEPAAAGEVVRAPLPGMIVAVKAEVGQQVNVGDVLAVLEAMKMENDITSPVSGTVKEVRVQKGAAVGQGDVLFVIG